MGIKSDNALSKQRLLWLDALKGFAIILVIIGHVSGSFQKDNTFPDAVIINDLELLVGTFHMKVFYMISGYLFCNSYLRDGIIRKDKLIYQILNLSLLYVFYDLLRYAFKSILSSVVNEKIDTSYLFMVWYKAIDEYWYIYGLIIIYALVVLLLNILEHIHRKSIMKGIEDGESIVLRALFLVCLLISIVFVIVNPQWKWSGVGAMNLIMFFSLSMLICKIGMKHLPLQLRFIEGTLGLIVVCIGTMIWTSIPRIIIFIAGGSIADFLFWFFRETFGTGDARKVNVLSYLGRHSLEIYLLHVYFTSGFRLVIRWTHINNAFAAFMIATIIGIVGPLMFSYCLQKTHLWSIFFNPAVFLKKKLTII